MKKIGENEFKKLLENDIANRVLYDMCQKYPSLNNVNQLSAKCFIIGRSYAVSPQRGVINGTGGMNYMFFDQYASTLLMEFQKISHIPDMDEHIKKLSTIRIDSFDTLVKGLEMVILFNESSYSAIKDWGGKNTISFATKLLHFHLPQLVYIKDQYSFANAKTLFTQTTKKLIEEDYEFLANKLTNIGINMSTVYFNKKYKDLIIHFARCYFLSNNVGTNGYILSPRDVDNYLIRQMYI
jgi:hypothetical protein